MLLVYFIVLLLLQVSNPYDLCVEPVCSHTSKDFFFIFIFFHQANIHTFNLIQTQKYQLLGNELWTKEMSI